MPPVALFVYGTLLLPERVRSVTGRNFASAPARLRDHTVFRIWDEAFPGLVPASGKIALGRLLHGVGERALGALDRFEGDLYERRSVVVTLVGGARSAAQVYLLAPSQWHRVHRAPWTWPRWQPPYE